MDKNKQKHFRHKLENLRNEYADFIHTLDDGLADPMTETINELSLYDNHPADVGSEVFERGKDIGFRTYALQQIEKVEDAIQKLEAGQYGYCDKCGKEIPIERLEAIPLTTMCVDCREEEWEDGHKYNVKARRPAEEEVVMPPFGGRSNNTQETLGDLDMTTLGQGRDRNEFSGEDAWQEVARYGTSNTPADIGNALSYNEMYVDFDEDRGIVQDIEQIPTYKDIDGQIYEDLDGIDDESDPQEIYRRKHKFEN